MTIWSGEIKELDKLFDSFKGQLPGIMKEMEQLIKTDDPNVVMLYSRRCLEVIITDLCEIELQRPRKTEPLKGIIDKLNSEDKVPSHIINSMLSLNSMASYGAHPKDFDPEQVKPVLNNLAIIIKWYLKYKNLTISGKTTPESKKNETSIQQSTLKSTKSLLKRPIFKLSGLIILIILALATIYFLRNSDESRKNDGKSIAVLPFENMSENKDLSWFGDAMTDEIIQQLYKIQEITVRPRQSVMQYKGTTKSTTVIGKELRVNYLIAGTAQRFEDHVRISVQLIDTKKDVQLWSRPFEGKTKDIPLIQKDIAKHLAEELKIVLSPKEIIQIDKISTDNSAAFDYYLLGNNYYQRGYEVQNIEMAAIKYQSAIELDPNFAMAYVRLSLCYSALHWFNYNKNLDRLGKSKEAIDMAFKLDSDLPQAHLALGFYYYWGFLEYVKALEEVKISQKDLRNNSECFYAIGNIYRRAGEWTLAKENFLKAVELDPTSAVVTFGLAETFSLSNEFEKAEEYYRQAIILNPKLMESIWQKSFMYLKWKGNTLQARETLEEAFRFEECKSKPILIEFSCLLDIYEGNSKKALDYLNSNDYDIINYHLYFNLKTSLYARIYDLLDMPQKAKVYYDSSRITLESRIIKNTDDPRLFSALGITYAGLGMKKQAIEAGKKGVDLMPINKEAYRGASRVEDLARIYVKVGEYAAALELIEQLLKIPSRVSVKLLLLDPDWKPLWNLPEFKKLVKTYSN
jgi:TolB-like protein